MDWEAQLYRTRFGKIPKLSSDDVIECEKWINFAKNVQLIKKTGPIRTMYIIEYKLWYYYQNQMKNVNIEKEKTIMLQINDEMRHTILVVNRHFDQIDRDERQKQQIINNENKKRNKENALKRKTDRKKQIETNIVRRSNRLTNNLINNIKNDL